MRTRLSLFARQKRRLAWNLRVDVAVMIASSALATWFRVQQSARLGESLQLSVSAVALPTICAALLAVLLWLIGSRALRMYDPSRPQGLLGDLALTLLLVWSTAIGLRTSELLAPWAFDLDVVRFLWLAFPATLAARTMLHGGLLDRAPEDGVLIIGAGALGRHTGLTLIEHGRTVAGYIRFPADPPSDRLPASLLGDLDNLDRVLRERCFDEVYVAGSVKREHESMQACIRLCERYGLPFALPASHFRFDRARTASSALRDGYVHYVTAAPKPLQLAAKRSFDIAASAIALVLLSPLLLVVALAIKLTSEGPIFFRQRRVGRFGRPFDMLKFRSMVVNAEVLKAKLAAQNEQTGPVFKMTNDPRVTPIGRFLRKYSIDELPQLINVLRGEMSIVGPRPAIPSEVEKYEGWQRRRLSLRPGLTCVWQVSGRNQISFEQWMYLDMMYIDHWSLAGDLKLIARTVPVVLTGRGAS